MKLLPLIPSLRDAAIPILHLSAIINGSMGPYVMGAVSSLSSTWFPPHERARATAVAILANNLGSAAGFILGPYLVTTADKMPLILWTHAVLSIIGVVVAVLFFSASPPSPPSHSAASSLLLPTNSGSLMDSLKLTWKLSIDSFRSPSAVILLVGGGMINGVFNGWTGAFATILKPLHIDETEAGWLGFGSTIATIVGGMLFGVIADTPRYKRRLKELLIVNTVLCSLCVLWFILSSPLNFISDVPVIPSSDAGTYISIIAFGFFIGGGNPPLYELGAEMLYPIPELYSAGFCTFWNNLGSTICLFTLSNVSSTVINNFMLATCAVCSMAFPFIYQSYARSSVDDRSCKLKGESGSKVPSSGDLTLQGDYEQML